MTTGYVVQTEDGEPLAERPTRVEAEQFALWAARKGTVFIVGPDQKPVSTVTITPLQRPT